MTKNHSEKSRPFAVFCVFGSMFAAFCFVLTHSAVAQGSLASVGSPATEQQETSETSHSQAGKRPMTPDDLLAETVSPAPGAISPDGKRIAVVRNEDIWVYTTDGQGHAIASQRRASRHFEGFAGGELKWSPNGRRLLFGSTGQDGHFLEVWDAQTGHVKRVVDQNSWSGPYGISFAEWLDSEHVACLVPPPDVHSPDFEKTAAAGWEMFWRGTSTTASVIESGTSSGRFAGDYDDAYLAIVDMPQGTVTRRVLGMVAGMSLSPDRKYFAYFSQKPLPKTAPPEAAMHDMSSNGYAPIGARGGCRRPF